VRTRLLVRTGRAEGRTLRLSCLAALALAVGLDGCGSSLPGLGDDKTTLELGYIAGWGYYSRHGNMHSVDLDANVINTGNGNATLKRWSFTLQRWGETIATIEASNLGQYGLAISSLDTDLNSDGDSFAMVSLGSGGSTSGRAFYGADPPDQVIFRCTVKKAHGGDEDLEGQGTFQHTES
jgi:hypothetical protein